MSLFERFYRRGVWRHSLVAAAAFLLTSTAAAQSLPSSVAATEVGGGGPAAVRDHGAIFLNPANVVFNDRGGRVVMSFMPFSLSGGGNLVQFGFYNDGLTAGAISSEQKQALIDDWFGPAEKNQLRYAGVSAGVVPFALVVRNNSWGAGFAVQLRSHNRAGLNRGLVDLVLLGLDDERSVPLDAELESVNAVHLVAAYGRRVGERLTVGVAPRVILGTSYGRGRLASTVNVESDALIHSFDYTVRSAGSLSRDVLDRFEFLGADNPSEDPFGNPFGSVAGRGLGLDLGATYAWLPNVDVAFSLTDLGFISWKTDSREVRPTRSEFRFDGLALDLDRIDDEFDGNVGDYFSHVLDSLADDAYGTVNRTDGGFVTGTPAAMHLGSTLYFNNRLGAVSAGTTLPLNTAAGNLTRRPSIYIGMEYRLGRRYGVPLRAGVRAGGPGAVTTAVGVGLHTPVWEMAISAAASPSSETAGGGMRFTVGVSLMTLRFGR